MTVLLMMDMDFWYSGIFARHFLHKSPGTAHLVNGKFSAFFA